MKVCVVSESWLPRLDGVAVSLEVMIAALRRADDKIVLQAICPASAGIPPGTEAKRVSSVRTPVDGYPLVLATRSAMRTALTDLAPDVVHIHTQGPLGVCALRAAVDLAVPVVTTIHTDLVAYSGRYPAPAVLGASWAAGASGTRALAWPPVPTTVAMKTIKLFAELSAVVLAPSEKAAGIVRAASGRWVSVVPTPRSLAVPDELDRWSARQRIGLPTDRLVITYLGRLAREKDIDTLLQAVAEGAGGLRTAYLVVAGPGRDRRKLERHAAALGLEQRIRFLGAVSPTEVPALLVATDIVAMPSRTDTQSLVLSEAASLGVPAVIRDAALCDGEAIVSDGRSGLVERSGRSFAETLRMVADSPDLRHRLGSSAKARARTVGAQFGQRLIDTYSMALGDDSATPALESRAS